MDSRRRRNWTGSSDEAAEYALRRWGRAYHVSTTDPYRGMPSDPSWPEFASWIRQTGDPGADEIADAIERRSGRVRDFPIRVEPRSRRRRPNPDQWDVQVVHLDVFGKHEHQYGIGVKDERALVGFMEVRVDDLDNVAYVQWIEVDPRYRRKGVARAMYHALYQWAAKEGLRVEHGMTTELGAATLEGLSPELDPYRHPNPAHRVANKAQLLAIPRRGIL